MFLKEAPHSTGTIEPEVVAFRMARWISSKESSSPARYLPNSSSSCSTAASITSCRAASTRSRYASGTGISVNVLPNVSSSKMISTRRSTSMCPVNISPEPTGSWIGYAFLVSRSRIMARQRSKSAPTRSILLAKIRRGTPYRSAWRHTVSVCGSTPATESSRVTAPSSTRRERSTSTVKSTCPGVSMMLIRYRVPFRFQKQVVAAEVMVIPRSCSCSIQSMVAAPSWTSPIL